MTGMPIQTSTLAFTTAAAPFALNGLSNRPRLALQSMQPSLSRGPTPLLTPTMHSRLSQSLRLSNSRLFAAHHGDHFESINDKSVPAWKAEVTGTSAEALEDKAISKKEIMLLVNSLPTAYIFSHSSEEAAITVAKLADTLSHTDSNTASNIPAQLIELSEAGTGGDTSKLSAKILHQPNIRLDQLVTRLNHLGFSVETASTYHLANRSAANSSPHDAEALSHSLMELTLIPLIPKKHATLSEAGPNQQAIAELLSSTLTGEIESDPLNSLAFTAGLGSRPITLLRALTHYSGQLFSGKTESDMTQGLAANPVAAKAISDHFEQRFNPSLQASHRDTLTPAKQAISDIQHSEHYDALNQLLTLIEATDRTNLYQTDEEGQPKPYVSFKVAPRRIPGTSLPTPRNEIFVYSPSMEGVHLRFGAMSRGGLRWITPQNIFGRTVQDFRTEVYGLAKAQQVKNSLVVPMGSKGGFLIKGPDAARAKQPEAIKAYKTLLSGMLDLTDTLKGGETVPPKQVVCHDAPDPYLVVAADKGTATFSDIGNSVSADYKFWLDDAFASGGKNGYDHKKMGITARGAWKSVERHFKELGKDIENETFTTIGIGSMSGDVFGNGMLMSKNTELTAAISSREIFIDPNPNAADSFEERQRLFEMPRANWSDYNPDKISAGGGVFSRKARAIPISPQMQARFNIQESVLSGPELVNRLLKAPTDLLWNGAIGTYIKSSEETHSEAKDPSNDLIRINANEVGANIIGEGGNLGVTQKARIEFSLNGGRVNTDFIDNVSGVDCSDHEVNTKILLQPLVESGELSAEDRNRFLESLTDEVASSVLSNNYWQNLALSLAEQDAKASIEPYIDQMNQLASNGHERKTYQLPTDKTLNERASQGVGLTRPELAYIVSLSKNELTQAILDNELTDQADASRYLASALPPKVVSTYPDATHAHPLKANIIATQISNAIINLMGPAYLNTVQKESGQPLPDVINAIVASFHETGVLDILPTLEASEASTSGKEMLSRLNELQRKVDAKVREQI